jgi:hypothetical protein
MSNGKQSAVSAPESRSGYNASGATIPEGTVVELVPAAAYEQIKAVDAIADVVYGVAGEDIPNLSYGLVLIRGRVPVLASAALTVGGIVTVTATGRAVNAATGGRIIGVACEVGSNGELTEVELSGPASPLSP